MNDTIVGLSTALATQAVSIIRVSGSESIKIVNNIFKGKDLEKVESHTINYGHIFYHDKIIDEVLVSIMKSPKTYTKEDIVEINSHGGISTTNKIIEILLELGCRLAEPGEFTKRAFLNGRIDLIEAEAVNDLINAKTEKNRTLALNNMNGKLTSKINEIREELIKIISNIEVNIDYPEYEDINVVTTNEIVNIIKKIKSELEKLLKDSKDSNLIKNGINVAIIGKPNVGKSSILNHLLNEDKAIVTDIAGTTRDIVEGQILLNGTLINLIDTAGIRETNDLVEQIGVKKSLDYISKADLVLIVLNNNEELSLEDKEIIEQVSDNKRLIFVNKNDLPNKLKLDYKYVTGNTISKNGLDNLKNEIIKKFELDNIMEKDITYISNIRQVNHIKDALNSINSALDNINEDISIDIIEIDLRSAWESLGDIIGANYNEELIDNLFANFCLGK